MLLVDRYYRVGVLLMHKDYCIGPAPHFLPQASVSQVGAVTLRGTQIRTYRMLLINTGTQMKISLLYVT